MFLPKRVQLNFRCTFDNFSFEVEYKPRKKAIQDLKWFYLFSIFLTPTFVNGIASQLICKLLQAWNYTQATTIKVMTSIAPGLCLGVLKSFPLTLRFSNGSSLCKVKMTLPFQQITLRCFSDTL